MIISQLPEPVGENAVKDVAGHGEKQDTSGLRLCHHHSIHNVLTDRSV